MRRFKNILVVFDSKTDNRALLNHAVDLAQRNQAALKIIDVMEEASPLVAPPVLEKLSEEAQSPDVKILEELPLDTSILTPIESSIEGWKGKGDATEKLTIDIQELIKQEEQHDLQEFVSAIKNNGVKVNSKTVYGIPFIEIIREVLKSQHDLVMITAESIVGLKGRRIGNTTMHLMRKCPCPVWVIKPGQQGRFTRILAAVDLVQNDENRTALNKKIIELASSLARSGNSELIVVHAWQMVGESIIRGRGNFSTEQIEKLLHETRNAHRHLLIEFLRQHPLEDLKNEVYLLKGEAGVLITEIARTKGVELIVMGTVSRAGIAGFLIGNTAEKVLNLVDCSILTVKPEGFVTPVKLEQE